MTTCEQCGHQLGSGLFCTQCGTRVDTSVTAPEPALATAGAFGGPTAPPPQRSRYPLYDRGKDEDGDKFGDEPADTSLAETAVRPIAGLGHSPSGAHRLQEPVGGERLGKVGATAERVSAGTKRWLATADQTWVMVLGIGLGAMLALLLLGMILLLH